MTRLDLPFLSSFMNRVKRESGVFLGVVSLVAGAATAQQISNVQARQLTQTPQNIEVTYDLALPNVSGTPVPGFKVTVAFASDGTNFSILPPASSLSGDAGSGVFPGTGKRIVWDTSGTLPVGTFGSNYRAQVTVITEGEDLRDITIMLPGEVPMVLSRIPSGTFQMGSPDSEKGRQRDEGPVHEVTLENDYFIGKAEVTQGQWKALMGNTPAPECGNYGVGDSFPVNCVTYGDITGTKGFILKLNAYAAATGQQGAGEFRLPTEAEWERAARAGSTSRFSFGDALTCGDGCTACPEAASYMWWCANAGRQSHEVESKEPNVFGLHDVHGNVWEWVSDWYGAYSADPQTNPAGPSSGVNRVIRGGAWWLEAKDARSARRGSMNPVYRTNILGFRVARRAISGINGYSGLFSIDLRGPEPVITDFKAEPASVYAGQALTLSWRSEGGTRAEIDQNVGAVPTTGSVKVYPLRDTTYTLKVDYPGGKPATKQASVTVIPGCSKPDRPVFNALSSTTIVAGQSVTLSWSGTVTQESLGTYMVDVVPNASCTGFTARYPTRDATLTFTTQPGTTAYCFVVRAVAGDICASDASDPLTINVTP